LEEEQESSVASKSFSKVQEFLSSLLFQQQEQHHQRYSQGQHEPPECMEGSSGPSKDYNVVDDDDEQNSHVEQEQEHAYHVPTENQTPQGCIPHPRLATRAPEPPDTDADSSQQQLVLDALKTEPKTKNKSDAASPPPPPPPPVGIPFPKDNEDPIDILNSTFDSTSTTSSIDHNESTNPMVP
jgi:hypothetical protein